MKKLTQTQKTISKNSQISNHNYTSCQSSSKQICSLPSHQIDLFSPTKQQYQLLRRKNAKFKKQHLFQLLSSLSLRRKRFSFQLIKQFFLFPDQTISDNVSLDSYDRLLFNDEPIHTLVKIYQTKQIQMAIWAFLNLKALRLKKKLQKFSAEVQNIQHKVQFRNKKIGFGQMKTYSIKIPPKMQKQLPIQRNQIVSNKIAETINVKKPEVIRIKSTSPQIPKVELSPSRTRIIYPTEPHIRQQPSIRKSQPKIVYSNPRQQTLPSTYHYNHSPIHHHGSACIHIHSCCRISCCQNHMNCANRVNTCSCGQNQQKKRRDVEQQYDMGQRIQYMAKLTETVEKIYIRRF